MRVRSVRAVAVSLSIVVAGCGTNPPSPAPSASPPAASQTSAVACVDLPDASPATDLPWWSERVFYEVFVRSFADSDDDGIGDLRGLTERLDYLNDGDPSTTDDLGVTGIWLMPVAEAASYHGYDVTDYRAIEADYGTSDDFRAFLAAAEERGIAVIVDFVINHTSVEHPWFEDARTPGSEHDDWYVWADETPFAKPDGGRAWFEAGDRHYYAYFWEGMPDLNLVNPAVTAELGDIAGFWLDDLGVDGFRIDAARHLIEDGGTLQNTPETFAWLAAFRDTVHATEPDALVLGEVWDPTSMTAKYVREGSLDLAFDFDLANAILGSVRGGSAGSYRAALSDIVEAYPPGQYATFLTNHDQDRVLSQLDGDIDAARLAATLLLTSPGVPFVYYGEEIGMTGSKPDERIRTSMRWDGTQPGAGFSEVTPWQPLSDDPPEVAVSSQTDDSRSILSTYRSLIALRAAHPALATGGFSRVDADDDSILSYLRSTPEESLLVVANLGSAAAPVLSLDAGPLCAVTSAELLLGTGTVAAPSISATGGFDGYTPLASLGPREAVVIRLNR